MENCKVCSYSLFRVMREGVHAVAYCANKECGARHKYLSQSENSPEGEQLATDGQTAYAWYLVRLAKRIGHKLTVRQAGGIIRLLVKLDKKGEGG